MKKRQRQDNLNIDAEKEATLKALCSELVEHGFVVRREKLRQGPGWRVLSGRCRVENNNVIFVDRMLPLTEQIEFLQSIALKLRNRSNLQAESATP